MVRDTLAVPAIGAGVETQFSRSGRIITPLRHRLSPETVNEIMMYKNHLDRKQQEFIL
jgi:hAT family C-terminal dimerisation region